MLDAFEVSARLGKNSKYLFNTTIKLITFLIINYVVCMLSTNNILLRSVSQKSRPTVTFARTSAYVVGQVL